MVEFCSALTNFKFLFLSLQNTTFITDESIFSKILWTLLKSLENPFEISKTLKKVSDEPVDKSDSFLSKSIIISIELIAPE